MVGRFEGIRVATFPEATLAAVVERVDTDFARRDFAFKLRRYQQLGRITLPDGTDVAVKRWRRPRLSPWITSPARRAAGRSRWLRGSGIPTPELLAVLDARESRRGFPGCMILHRWRTGHTPVSLHLAEHPPYGDALQPLLLPIARLVARMHERRLVHRDLRLENFLLRDESMLAGVPEITLVDTDEVERRHPAEARCVRDLANLVFHLRRIAIAERLIDELLGHYAGLRLRSEGAHGMARFIQAVKGRAQRRADLREARERFLHWLPRLRAKKIPRHTHADVRRAYGL